jgi:uncharacterized membrane-anchored protein
MNVSDQIIQVLDDLCRRFGIVIDWKKETIAPYLMELSEKFIAFEVQTSWFWIISALSIAGILWIMSLVCSLIHGFDSEGAMSLGIIAIVATVFAVVVSGVQIYDIITCETFPEKILLREIKELFQNAKNY